LVFRALKFTGLSTHAACATVESPGALRNCSEKNVGGVMRGLNTVLEVVQAVYRRGGGSTESRQRMKSANGYIHPLALFIRWRSGL
jgi:hypothetical protein